MILVNWKVSYLYFIVTKVVTFINLTLQSDHSIIINMHYIFD